MAFAVVLALDAESDRMVRDIWKALDHVGIRSPDSAVYPHVSLAAFTGGDISAVAAHLRRFVATANGIPLPLESLGFFLTTEMPAFLAVTPSLRLLTLHRAVSETIRPLVTGYGSYYEPDRLSPHCTLAMGADDRRTVIDTVANFRLPIMATTSAMRLMEFPSS